MKKTIFLLILCLTSFFGKSQTCIDTIRFDDMSCVPGFPPNCWFGDWSRTPPIATTLNTGFSTGASVSPNVSAVIYGVGAGSTPIERDRYVMPNITGLNPTSTHRFSFRLGSYSLINSSGAGGVDIGDSVVVQLSTNGGITYTNEMYIRGANNALWNYNTNATALDTAGIPIQTFSPSNLGLRDRTNLGDGFSVIQLIIPPGPTQIAVNILCIVNAAGEEWWIDNVLLEEIYDCTFLPIELLYFGAEYDKNNKDVNVNWGANVTNLDEYFIVEKSSDSHVFDSIGVVFPTEIGTNDYTFIDGTTIYNGYTYYRLKMVERNNHHYSNTIAIEVNNIVNKIIVLPNPFNDYIKVQNLGDYNGPCEVKIYNTTGIEVISQSFQLGIINKTEINTKDLSPGVYNVVIKTSRNTETHKIVK